MADDKDILFNMFKHYMDEAIHHQVQRSATANIVLILSGALIGLVTFDQKLGGTDFIAAIFLIGLGLFGALWSAKQHERFAYYLKRARGYRDKLAARSLIDMRAINDLADTRTKKKYRLLHKVRLWYFWVFLYLLIVAVGILILVLCI